MKYIISRRDRHSNQDNSREISNCSDIKVPPRILQLCGRSDDRKARFQLNSTLAFFVLINRLVSSIDISRQILKRRRQEKSNSGRKSIFRHFVSRKPGRHDSCRVSECTWLFIQGGSRNIRILRCTFFFVRWFDAIFNFTIDKYQVNFLHQTYN